VNPLIFAVGVFVFLLLAGGLTFTIIEVRRLAQAEPARRVDGRSPAPPST
jgi:hypothetical protein